MANINAPVCFLREIRATIGADTVGGLHEPGSERHFLTISAPGGTARSLPTPISYFSQVK
jgi:hypothetical protein